MSSQTRQSAKLAVWNSELFQLLGQPAGSNHDWGGYKMRAALRLRISFVFCGFIRACSLKGDLLQYYERISGLGTALALGWGPRWPGLGEGASLHSEG